jgi:hypothetical protein
VTSLSSAQTRYWTGYAGLPGPNKFLDFCTGSEMLFGLDVRSGTYINAVRGICDRRTLPLHGGSAGTVKHLTGPFGYMRGINAWSGDVIDSIQVVTYWWSSGWGYSGWAGGSGGYSYSALRCGEAYHGKAIRGETGELVDRISLLCATD